ncbi:MAG: TolC family protein [Betaproteobacteria bacterium]|nr:MAG: TolC family protein [Betaproteobacteria bacterium]
MLSGRATSAISPEKRLLAQAFASCASAALMGAAVAAPASLSLTEAQRLAIERSPQMAVYDAAIAAARDLAVAPAQLPEATRQIGITPLPIEDADALSFGRDANPVRRIGVPRELTSPEQREALAERYAREADRAAAQKTATSVDVTRETALAWLECYYVEQMTRIAGEELKAAQDELEGAESMYWAGRLSQAEFYGARSMLVMLEDKSSGLEHRVRAARIALKRWVGDVGDAPLAALPNIDRIRLRSAALEGDLARHPEVALLERQEDLAASDVRLAQANRQSEREIALMRARRGEARAARDEKLRAKVAETRIMIDEWQHARDRRDRYANELVRLARERTLATLVAYRGGKASLTDVLAARRAESEAQVQSVEMEREAARIWARLDFALPETLPTAPSGSSRQESAR